MQVVNTRKKGGRSSSMDEELIYEILSVVEEIPEGRVASYGQIAELIGRRKNARLVGKCWGWLSITVNTPVTGSLTTPDVSYRDGMSSAVCFLRKASR